MRQKGRFKNYAMGGLAALAGFGAGYVAHKARQDNRLPGTTSPAGDGHRHSHQYTDRFGQTWTPGPGGTWAHGNWTAHQHPGRRAWYDPRPGPR